MQANSRTVLLNDALLSKTEGRQLVKRLAVLAISKHGVTSIYSVGESNVRMDVHLHEQDGKVMDICRDFAMPVSVATGVTLVDNILEKNFQATVNRA